MLPQNLPSKIPVPRPFLVPNRQKELIDYEWGGVAIQNTSLGLRHSLWECSYFKPQSSIVIRRTDLSEYHTIITGVPRVTRVGLAFDFNMRPTICFVQDEVSKLYWYDTAQNKAIITEFAGMENPCISLDDTRLHQSHRADIILAYQRGRDIFIRQQRDRYQKEILFKRNFGVSMLFQVGMNTGNRFEFKFK